MSNSEPSKENVFSQNLAKNYILAIDAKTGIRLPKGHKMRHRDVVKIKTRTQTKYRKWIEKAR